MAEPLPVEETGPEQVEEIVTLIGPKLKALRQAQGHSLQGLAGLSNVSAAAIHKIERNGMVPSITTLLKLGTALGVPVGYFVQGETPPPEPVHFVPADCRPPVYTPHRGLDLAGISGPYRQFQAAAAVATLRAGASSGTALLEHPGEELVHVTDGTFTFTVGEHEFVLGAGDSLHFSGAVPHQWANRTRRRVTAIWVALRD
jgi:transcriptional regulator with XRE-family HTH domain